MPRFLLIFIYGEKNFHNRDETTKCSVCQENKLFKEKERANRFNLILYCLSIDSFSI